MLSAAFDFLGEMIEQAHHIYTRKVNEFLPNNVKESFAMDEYSIQGSYNSNDDVITSPIKKK